MKAQGQTTPAPTPSLWLALNQWGLGSQWNVSAESSALRAAPGKVMIRFHARDLNMVLGPGKSGRPVRFRVTLDGAPPEKNHGIDIDTGGFGEIREPRSINSFVKTVPCKTEARPTHAC